MIAALVQMCFIYPFLSLPSLHLYFFCVSVYLPNSDPGPLSKTPLNDQEKNLQFSEETKRVMEDGNVS